MLTRSHRLRGRRHIRLQNLAFCLNKNSDYFKSFTTDAWLQEVTMILVKTLYWCLYDGDRFVIILVIFPILGIGTPESQIGHQQKRSPTSVLNIEFTLKSKSISFKSPAGLFFDEFFDCFAFFRFFRRSRLCFCFDFTLCSLFVNCGWYGPYSS